jgi:hypothetical protein
MRDTPDLNRLGELAERVADHILTAAEAGEFSTEDFQDSPEIALIGEIAEMLARAELEVPTGIRQLMERAAEQTQI